MSEKNLPSKEPEVTDSPSTSYDDHDDSKNAAESTSNGHTSNSSGFHTSWPTYGMGPTTSSHASNDLGEGSNGLGLGLGHDGTGLGLVHSLGQGSNGAEHVSHGLGQGSNGLGLSLGHSSHSLEHISNSLGLGLGHESNSLVYDLGHNSNSLGLGLGHESNSLVYDLGHNSNSLGLGLGNDSNSLVYDLGHNSNSLGLGLGHYSNSLGFGLGNDSNSPGLGLGHYSNSLVYDLGYSSNSLGFGLGNDSNSLGLSLGHYSNSPGLGLGHYSNSLVYDLGYSSNSLGFGLEHGSNSLGNVSNSLGHGLGHSSNSLNHISNIFGPTNHGPANHGPDGNGLNAFPVAEGVYVQAQTQTSPLQLPLSQVVLSPSTDLAANLSHASTQASAPALSLAANLSHASTQASLPATNVSHASTQAPAPALSLAANLSHASTQASLPATNLSHASTQAPAPTLYPVPVLAPAPVPAPASGQTHVSASSWLPILAPTFACSRHPFSALGQAHLDAQDRAPALTSVLPQTAAVATPQPQPASATISDAAAVAGTSSSSGTAEEALADSTNPKTNLIVNYLPQSMTQEEFRKLFASVGEIQSYRLVWDKVTGQSLGYGFINYVNPRDAEKALRLLNGLQCPPKTIKVSYARPYLSSIQDANLYISGLPKTMTEKELEQLFSPYGNIITSRILTDRVSGASRGVGFILFNVKSEAEEAIKALNGQKPLSILEPLTVKFAHHQNLKTPQSKLCQLPQCYQGPVQPPTQGLGLDMTCGVHRFSPSPYDGMTSLVGMTFRGHTSSSGSGGSSGIVSGGGSSSSGGVGRGGSRGGSSSGIVSGGSGSDGNSTSWCIFVYNLSPECDENALLQLFGPFGAVRNVRIIRDVNTKKCKGFGFITMTSYDNAALAIASLNGYCFHGRVLQVSFKTNKIHKA